jgi:hypothetical protein
VGGGLDREEFTGGTGEDLVAGTEDLVDLGDIGDEDLER